MRFDHVGVATEDAEGLAFLYEDLLGCPIVHEERFEELKIIFLELENGYFELLEPQADGTIARYLDEHGDGIHHVAIETDDIEGALETAEAEGIELIDPEPRQGAWGHQVAFLHPGSTGGVLVEFVEH
jgi:methylmalonyl-CoA/ethylmalonyl-CoA epimerase